MKKENYNIIDLFCGTGGFSYGFTQYNNKFKVVAAVDILEIATKTMKANHRECVVYNEDIRKISPETVSKEIKGKQVDVIIGGPPCQGFSSIRPFRSQEKNDDRNTLFEQFAIYVDFFKPQIFVFENVVGLVTYNGGKTLEAIQNCFREIGYDTEWRILNAANYGVPQKRERFIMIGRPIGNEINFPKATHAFNGKTIGTKDRNKMEMLKVQCDDLPPALTIWDAISDLPEVESGHEILEYDKSPENEYQMARRNGAEHLTMHRATLHPPKMLEIIKYAGDSIKSIPEGMITSGFSSCYSRLRADEPGVTITVKFTNPASSKCIHPFQNRALTPREGARIQSFDDTYIFCGSKTQITTQIGNAVPPQLGSAIAKSVLEMMEDEDGSN